MKRPLQKALAVIICSTMLLPASSAVADRITTNAEKSSRKRCAVDRGVVTEGEAQFAAACHGSDQSLSEQFARYEIAAADNVFRYDTPGCWWSETILTALALALANGFESKTELRTPDAPVYGWRGASKATEKNALARLVGRPDNIEELVRRLILAVRELSAYDIEVEAPTVHIVSLAELQRTLCGRPCTVRAAYVPGEGLYIDEMMRPLSDQFDQSILFHELVHHVQIAASGTDGKDECQRWRKRESEAYALQNHCLFALGSSSRVVWPGKLCARARSNAVSPEIWFGRQGE